MEPNPYESPRSANAASLDAGDDDPIHTALTRFVGVAAWTVVAFVLGMVLRLFGPGP